MRRTPARRPHDSTRPRTDRYAGTIGRTTTQHARSTLVHVSLHARGRTRQFRTFPFTGAEVARHPGLRTSRSRPGGRPGLTCYMFMFMYRTVVPHLTSYDLSCCVVRNPAKSVERKLLQRARAGGAVVRGCAFDFAPVEGLWARCVRCALFMACVCRCVPLRRRCVKRTVYKHVNPTH